MSILLDGSDPAVSCAWVSIAPSGANDIERGGPARARLAAISAPRHPSAASALGLVNDFGDLPSPRQTTAFLCSVTSEWLDLLARHHDLLRRSRAFSKCASVSLVDALGHP